MFKLDNEAVITLRSGDTGEVIWESKEHNDISDDFLCGHGRIYSNNEKDTSQPYCFLLNDGAAWAGFTFDRTNPSAPYCIQSNNFDHTGAQVDPLGQTSIAAAATVFTPYGSASVRSPFTAGTNNVNKWRLFYRWTSLPVDFQLKALGLTAWQQIAGNLYNDFVFGAQSQPTIYMPDTLVVLPTSVTVHGRNGGSTTPDTLEISYYLSIVGA